LVPWWFPYLAGGAKRLGYDEEDDHQGTKTPRKKRFLRELRVSVVNLNAISCPQGGGGFSFGNAADSTQSNLALAPALIEALSRNRPGIFRKKISAPRYLTGSPSHCPAARPKDLARAEIHWNRDAGVFRLYLLRCSG
jgi:hypothetical protein